LFRPLISHMRVPSVLWGCSFHFSLSCPCFVVSYSVCFFLFLSI
jgi:hypothetical protein